MITSVYLDSLASFEEIQKHESSNIEEYYNSETSSVKQLNVTNLPYCVRCILHPNIGEVYGHD